MSLWGRLFGKHNPPDALSPLKTEPPHPTNPPSPSQPSSGDQVGTETQLSVFARKARPIFFSSTFKDMHAERDYLRDHNFLRLAEKLRDRFHYLNTIDLRQGVESAYAADERKRELQVLTVCLDEIRRSKPFLVPLLGDRYGWIPPDERITAAARAAGLPESVEVVEDSHDLAFMLVVTQLPIDRWHDNIKEATIADAILDRLVHNAYKINLKGDSLRKLRSALKNTHSEKLKPSA